MRKLLLLIILIPVAFGIISAQNLLSPNWKFQTGDQASFFNLDYDESKWVDIEVGKLWESQGHDYDGYAWYRLEVKIPKKLKKEAKVNGGLNLFLGKIDDADETFWNGKLIGATGKMPPNHEGAYATPRIYKIPFEAINFGETHLLAVRVYDNGGGGGIYGNEFHLGLPRMKDLVLIAWADKNSNQIFNDGNGLELAFELENKSKNKLSGELNIDIKNSFQKNIGSQNLPVSIKNFGKAKVSFQELNLAPGFYPSTLSFKSATEELKKEIVLGVDPTKIISPPDRPDNFVDYWRRAKKELAAVEPQFKLTKLEEHSKEKVNVYLLEMRSLGNVLVRGFYSRPKVDGIYPALLNVQGYSTSRTANDVYKGDDMVSLVLNIRGHGNSQDNIQGFPGYILNQIEDPEMYIYRGAYMDCIRAIDFLFEQKEVDQTRVAVAGGSQGGALSIATAALDNERIMACAPDVPFLSDFKDYFVIAPWPGGEVFNYIKDHPDFSEEAMYKTLSYIDIKNLAQDIKAPVFMGIGILDMVCPPHINFAAYNQVTTKKSYVAYPNAGHGLPAEHYAVKMQWLKKQFGM